MKIFLEKAIFVNKAPFDKLELDFKENEISTLSAMNGKGKTTILSHIVDAFYEMARPNFQNEFDGKENKLYRLSSPLQNLLPNKPSFVYFRFKVRTEDKKEETVDYIEIRNKCSEEDYNEAIPLDGKILFSNFQRTLNELNYAKITSPNTKTKVEEIFSQNILTYFPSYTILT